MFFDRIDDYVYGDCTDEEFKLFEEHMNSCMKCKEEYEFSLSIKKAMSSMPEITPPADFSKSLNERLDKELIKPVRPSVYKRYSVAAACVALVAILGVDTVKLTKDTVVNDSHLPFDKNDISSVPEKLTVPEDEQLPLQNEPAIVFTVPENVNTIPVSEASTTPKLPENKVVISNQDKLPVKPEPEFNSVPKKNTEEKKNNHTYSDNVHETTPLPIVETKKKSEPVIVKKDEVKQEEQNTEIPEIPEVTTPHKTFVYEKNNIPEYMDPREHVVLASVVENEYATTGVNLEDLPVKERDLRAEFALLENPKTGNIIATPATVASLDGVQIQEVKSNRKGSDEYGVGSGSIFISAKDIEFVNKILIKYTTGEENSTYFLTGDNFKSFTDELEMNGISFEKRLISQEGKNIAFKVVVC